MVCTTVYISWNLSKFANECLPTITRKSRLVLRWRQWAAVKTVFSEIIAPPQWWCHVFMSECNACISTWENFPSRNFKLCNEVRYLTSSYLPRISAIRSGSTSYYLGRRTIETHLLWLMLYGAMPAIRTFVRVWRRRCWKELRRFRETPEREFMEFSYHRTEDF